MSDRMFRVPGFCGVFLNDFRALFDGPTGRDANGDRFVAVFDFSSGVARIGLAALNAG